MTRYVSALCRDLTQRSEACRDYTVDTVYIGGGTPTLLPPALSERVLETLFSAYRIAPDAEITMECNPATADDKALSRLKAAGVNRLSVGLQSTHENELKALGRLHDFADFQRTWQWARDAGFTDLSADVMFGIPAQTTGSYLQTLERLAALEPSHVSAYSLIVEEGTPFFGMRERLRVPDEDQVTEMYLRGAEYLSSVGLFQYEISNFARDGYRSRHNLKYWNCDEYLGFGPAAYSDFGGVRYGNNRDLAAYIEGREITAERETPTPWERVNEYVMLRLRLTDGIATAAFCERFHTDFEETFGEKLSRFLPMGLVKRTEEGYALTENGMCVSNAILSEILDFAGD